MKLKVLSLSAVMLFAPAITSGATDLHPKVQAALDWTLPDNRCEQPKLPGAGKDVVDTTGASNREGVDSYKLSRFNRAETRWKKCVVKYKKGLLKEFDELKNSAQYGLTEPQAKAILAKMATIQSVIESPTGVLEEQ